MTNPFFSIIIPTYNRAYCISDCLNSCLIQSFQDFEIIIADDASTDNLNEVLAPYLKDTRIKLFRLDKNSWSSAARNFAISKASGIYVAHLDTDDTWDKDKLLHYHAAIKDLNYPKDTLFYSKYALMREGRKPIIKNMRGKQDDESVMDYHFGKFEGVLNTNVLCLSLELARSCPYREDVRTGEDIALAWDIEKTGGKFVWIDKVLTYICDEQRPDRTTQNKNFEPLLYWYQKVQEGMSPTIRSRFEAKRIAPRMAYKNVLMALKLWFSAVIKGRLTFMEALKSFVKIVRSFIMGSYSRFIPK